MEKSAYQNDSPLHTSCSKEIDKYLNDLVLICEIGTVCIPIPHRGMYICGM